MPTVAFHTLGCKVNMYDTQAMLEAFERAGYLVAPFDSVADVYVINTCTVTGTGDKKSMQAVRRAKRLNPRADIVIAGCLAQREGEKLLDTGARLVIGTARRGEVVSLLEQAIAENTRVAAVTDVRKVQYEELFVTYREGRSRAVLKIQEGCDNFCAYCVIPYVRGGVRSRTPESVRAEAERLAVAGFEELVLTGIHLTSYGKDMDGVSLTDAVKACAVDGVSRIRLGSLEPKIVTEDFITAVKGVPQMCDQFHLALQSGCDDTLKRMRRRYLTDDFRRAAAMLRDAYPRCALTTDLITGFPGETDAEFAQSYDFCREMGFSRMHVFPYSEREGTLAATLPDSVPKATRESRAKEMIALGRDMALAYHQGMIGTVCETLFETCEDGVSHGYARNYAPCRARGDIHGVRLIRVLDADENGVAGEILSAD